MIDKYILYFNQRNFTCLTQLFTESGILAPPFEPQIIGRRAIYQYLQSSVQATFEPMFINYKKFGSARTQVDVSGTLKTDALTLKTDWTFLLNEDGKICLAQVKLRLPLAKLKNLSLHRQSFLTLHRRQQRLIQERSYCAPFVD
ncbi:MAG: hypothetical protein KME29_16285 [Calothrix sp. FI2-JRJ7]|jgi:hypothetical protein|nr:hypothetical protein [Calothrix sp. FI2-JRJ7]